MHRNVYRCSCWWFEWSLHRNKGNQCKPADRSCAKNTVGVSKTQSDKHTFICTHAHMQSHRQTDRHTHTHAHTHTHTYTHTHTRTHTHTHTHTHIYIHKHYYIIHVHTCIFSFIVSALLYFSVWLGFLISHAHRLVSRYMYTCTAASSLASLSSVPLTWQQLLRLNIAYKL